MGRFEDEALNEAEAWAKRLKGEGVLVTPAEKLAYCVGFNQGKKVHAKKTAEARAKVRVAENPRRHSRRSPLSQKR